MGDSFKYMVPISLTASGLCFQGLPEDWGVVPGAFIQAEASSGHPKLEFIAGEFAATLPDFFRTDARGPD